MITTGYSQYSPDLVMSDIVDFVPTEKEVLSKSDDLLDLIFCADPVTGFPSGSISQYLSDKTSDEVRDFIEKKILVDLPSQSDTSDYPEQIRSAIRELDPEFQLNCMRKRFESLDEYESRVKGYFDKIQSDKDSQKRLSDFMKSMKKRFPDMKV